MVSGSRTCLDLVVVCKIVGRFVVGFNVVVSLGVVVVSLGVVVVSLGVVVVVSWIEFGEVVGL